MRNLSTRRTGDVYEVCAGALKVAHISKSSMDCEVMFWVPEPAHAATYVHHVPTLAKAMDLVREHLDGPKLARFTYEISKYTG